MEIQKGFNRIKGIRKILIINLGGIGDVLLSTPAIRALKSLFSQATISVMVVPRVYEIINDSSYIDEAFIFHKSATKIFKNIKILLILRKRHFDLAINMRTLATKKSAKKIKFLLNIINPRIKMGRDTEGRGYFFDIKIPETDIGKFEMEYDIDAVRALGGDVVDRSIDFNINKTHLEKVNKLLEKERVPENGVLIGIHPGGKPCHRWPLKNFTKVIDKLHKEISCKFVITGGKEELKLASKLMKITADAKMINLAGRLNIKELGALIKRCNLFISNDTGPMHVATILKTPLIAIFGPGCIKRYDPRYISDKAIVLYKKIECAPCERVTCDSMGCLKAILPEEVSETALRLLMH